MAESLGDLVVRIGGDTSGFESSMRKAKTGLTGFADSAKSAVPNIAAVGAAAAVAAAVGVAALISKTMDAVGAQADLAVQLGTTSASIATMSHAASLSGLEFSKVTAASNFLNVQLAKASEEGSKAAETFARLQLSASALQAMPLDERISTINQALIDNVAASDRAAVAAEVFGAKAGGAMRMLQPDAIAEAAAQVEKLGLNISEIDAAKIEQAGDAVEVAAKVFDGVIQQFTLELSPIITAIANQFFDSTTSIDGFGTAGKNAAGGLVDGIGFVMDVVEGLKRTFYLAGEGIEVFGLTSAQSVLRLGNAIEEGAIKKLNALIDTINTLPGIDIEKIAPVGSLSDEIATLQDSIESTVQGMHETMTEPMPSDQFKDFVAQARIAAEEAAAVQVEMQKSLGGEGTGEDSGNPKENETKAKADDSAQKAAQAAKDAAAKDLADRVNAVRASNATELEIVAQKEAAELATLQAAREQNLLSEAEYLAMKAETEARFSEDRLAGITAANATELELAAVKHALELEALDAALANKRLSEDEYNAIRLETMKRHGDEAAAIKQREEEAKTKIQKEQEAARKAALGDALSNLTTLMNSGSRKMFEVGKAAAISQTVLSTYEGAQKAYSSLAGIPVVGPALGVAAAGAAIAAGVARVQSIRSQSFGGGASTPTGSNTGQVNAGSQPVSGSSGGGGASSPGQTMYIQGLNKNDLYSGSQLVDLINHAQENGARLRVL